MGSLRFSQWEASDDYQDWCNDQEEYEPSPEEMQELSDYQDAMRATLPEQPCPVETLADAAQGEGW